MKTKIFMFLAIAFTLLFSVGTSPPKVMADDLTEVTQDELSTDVQVTSIQSDPVVFIASHCIVSTPYLFQSAMHEDDYFVIEPVAKNRQVYGSYNNKLKTNSRSLMTMKVNRLKNSK